MRALILAAGMMAAPAMAAPTGEQLFARCTACHAIGGTATKMGPNLQGVYGRKVATVKGFDYSAALKAQTFTWNDATLDKWLTKPMAMVPGTTMFFLGLPDPADRKTMIAYLKKAK